MQYAPTYIPYAIKNNIYRSHNFRKSKTEDYFQNTTKITFDVGKTVSYVEKIMSDIIQTTSDLFSPFASL